MESGQYVLFGSWEVLIKNHNIQFNSYFNDQQNLKEKNGSKYGQNTPTFMGIIQRENRIVEPSHMYSDNFVYETDSKLSKSYFLKLQH